MTPIGNRDRWLITGAGGAVGSDLSDLLRRRGDSPLAATHADLDIGDETAVRAMLADAKPAVVLNAAAYTRVDDAESEEPIALRINGEAPGVLARWCAANHARLIHVSTDYVFPGDATTPYEIDDAPEPRSAYGRTKLAGERAVLTAGGDCHVVRTAWVYGLVGTNFIRTIGRRLRAGTPVDVVDDQRGAPTWSRDLASALIELATSDAAPGLWHCSSAGAATWYDVASALADELGVDSALVRRTTSASMSRPAPRPSYSVLSNRKWRETGLTPLPDWRAALHHAISTLGDALTE